MYFSTFRKYNVERTVYLSGSLIPKLVCGLPKITNIVSRVANLMFNKIGILSIFRHKMADNIKVDKLTKFLNPSKKPD